MASLLGRSAHLPVPPPGPENQSRILLEMSIALPIIAAFFVLMRCCSTQRIGRKLSVDDYLLVSATVLLLLQGGMIAAGCILGILGLQDKYIGTEGLEMSYRFVLFLQTSYVIAISAAKMSIALLELRLFSNRKTHRRILWLSIAVIAISTIVTFCFLLFRCSPIEKFWNWNLAGTCSPALQGTIVIFVFSGIHILLDFLYAGLPMTVIWKLQLNTGMKIQLSILFGLVFMASVATIGRFYYLRKLVTDVDIIWGYNSIIAWSLLELMLSIVTASACTLRPFTQRIAQWFKLQNWSLFDGNHFRKIREGRASFRNCGKDIEAGIAPSKVKDLSLISESPDLESQMTPYTEDAKILQLPGAAILSGSRFSDFNFGLPSARTPSTVNSRAFGWPTDTNISCASSTFNDRATAEEALWATTCTTTITAGTPLPRSGLRSILSLHRTHNADDMLDSTGSKPSSRTRTSRGSFLSTATLRSFRSPNNPMSILSKQSACGLTTTDISLGSISPIDDTTTLATSKCSSEQDHYFSGPRRFNPTRSHRHSQSTSSAGTKVAGSESRSEGGLLVAKEHTKEPVHVRFGDANGFIHRTTDVVVVSRRKESLVREMMKLIS